MGFENQINIKRPQQVWQYESVPAHTANWERGFRTLTHWAMLGLATGVIAHPWDFDTTKLNPNWVGKVLPGDPKAFSIREYNSVLRRLDLAKQDSRWGWQTAYILRVDQEEMEKRGQEARGWHYVYDHTLENVYPGKEVGRCKILVPIEEQAKILIGPSNLKVFTLDSADNELPITVHGPIHRADPRFKNARLL